MKRLDHCETCRERRELGYPGPCRKCQAAIDANARAAEIQARRERAERDRRNGERLVALNGLHGDKREEDLTEDECEAIHKLWVDNGRMPLPASSEHVLDVAEALGRKPSTVAFRLSNLTHLDTEGAEGLDHYGAALLVVWERHKFAVAS